MPTLRPTSRAWLRNRNLLTPKTQQDGVSLSPLGMKYLLVVMMRNPCGMPSDIQTWMLRQPLMMPMVPGVQ